MAIAPENPGRANESEADGLERPLDLDISSTNPYPRPRTSRRGARTIWLAAGVALVVLGLTWLLFRSGSGEEPAPPSSAAAPPPAPPVSVTRTEPDHAPSAPAEGLIDFAPVLDQPEYRPQRAADTSAPAPIRPKPPAEAPSQPAASSKPKPADTPPVQVPSSIPADTPADTAAEAADQPDAGPEKSASKTTEISDKWVVNIYSTPDATESLRFLSTLLGQDVGGRVYASEAILEGRLQHRIRVGFFDTREEAEAVGLKIKERYQLYSAPWAVKPTRDEENKFGGR